jgi:hypothetical protein
VICWFVRLIIRYRRKLRGRAGKLGHGTWRESTSIGLTLAATCVVSSANTFATWTAFAATPTLDIGDFLAATCVVSSANTFATWTAFAATLTLDIGDVLTATCVVRSAKTFAATRVAVMNAMPIEGRAVLGGQGGELSRIEHAIAILVVFGEQIGGGIRPVTVFTLSSAVRMDGGGKREAAEKDGECFGHVFGCWELVGVSRVF